MEATLNQLLETGGFGDSYSSSSRRPPRAARPVRAIRTSGLAHDPVATPGTEGTWSPRSFVESSFNTADASGTPAAAAAATGGPGDGNAMATTPPPPTMPDGNSDGISSIARTSPNGTIVESARRAVDVAMGGPILDSFAALPPSLGAGLAQVHRTTPYVFARAGVSSGSTHGWLACYLPEPVRRESPDLAAAMVLPSWGVSPGERARHAAEAWWPAWAVADGADLRLFRVTKRSGRVPLDRASIVDTHKSRTRRADLTLTLRVGSRKLEMLPVQLAVQ